MVRWKDRKWTLILPATLLVSLAVAWSALRREFATDQIPEVPNFSLLDQNGHRHTLYDYANSKAVVLIAYGNSCPIVQNYMQGIRTLASTYGDRGVTFLMIDAHTQDDKESIAAELKEYGVDIPVMIDRNQVVARALGIGRTTETLIFSPKGWRILYRGPIDDQMGYGVNKGAARHQYLADALEAVVKGREPEAIGAEVKGCAYSFWKSDHLTYGDHIAPTIQSKCAVCHSKSQTPPELTGESELQSSADKIRALLLMDRMPHGGGPDLDSESAYHLFTWLESPQAAAPPTTAGAQ